MTWLDALLTNSWMADPAFTTQMAHLFFAAFVLLMARLFRVRLLPVLIVGVVLAAVKEFVYDLRWELPPQTVGGSALDFGMYLVGLAVGVVVVAVADNRERMWE